MCEESEREKLFLLLMFDHRSVVNPWCISTRTLGRPFCGIFGGHEVNIATLA